MQVFPNLVWIVTKTMKIIKLHKTRCMATVYKPTSMNVNDYVDEIMILWSKSKLHYDKINKNNKMVMPFDKSNNIVRNKPLKPNTLYAHQPKLYVHATGNRTRPSAKSDKKSCPS